MSDLYSKKEILDHLKELETNLLKRVFESSYSENLRTYDLVNHVKGKASELGLDGCEEISTLLRDLDRLSSAIGGLINGNRGERMAEKSLSCLRCDNIALSGIALQNGSSFEEYDEIVITSSGVFLIEVKNFKHDAVVDECGILRCGACAYNVGERMREKEHALWNAIRFSASDFATEADIHSMLLFVNDDMKVSDFFCRVPIERRGQIVYDIEDARRTGRTLSREEMNRIRSSLIMRKVEATFPMPIDTEKIVHELEAAICLIEEKAKAVDSSVVTPKHDEVGAKAASTVIHPEEDNGPAEPTVSPLASKWLPAAAIATLGLAAGIGGVIVAARLGRSSFYRA